ncbi:MAG: hypothetical protein KatS3mg004_1850 [Bryobacteraceae bacterium]|nr:MAG: hypothetical protein KatS3mg004_1850 [Bryobacteraceae bacterium]
MSATVESIRHEHWITTGQAAKLLGVSRQTVRRWCRSGRLEWRRFDDSSHIRVSRLSIERILERLERLERF